MAEKQSMWQRFLLAQQEFPQLKKAAINPFTKSKYVDLKTLISAVRPVLMKYGFVLIQDVQGGADGAVRVQTRIIDVNTENNISSEVLVVPFAGQNLAQAMGAAITYGRRYSLMTLLGLVGDNDTDGEGAYVVQPGKTDDPLFTQAEQEFKAKGSAGYMAFFAKQSNLNRQKLVRSGVHDKYKPQAGDL